MNSGSPGLISLSILVASALSPIAARADSDLVPLGVIVNRGFCSNGAWDGTRWPKDERPDVFTAWGSYCGFGDANIGRIEFQEFLAPSVLNLYLAGYPGLPGRRLILKNVQTGQEVELQPRTTPGDEWRFDTLSVPPDWIGKPVELIAEDTATGNQGWLAFSLPVLPSSSPSLPAIDTSVPEGGFCAGGVYSTTKWPNGAHPPGIVVWGSFCKSGDAGTGWTASQPIIAESYVTLYVAGYPTNPGLRLAAENLQTGRQLLLQVPASPMEKWQLYHFHLPDDWKGRSVRIVAEDQNAASFGWFAFSEPVRANLRAEASVAAKTLGLLLLLAFVLLIPSVAASMLAAVRGVKDQLDLTAIAVLTLGLTGYAAFWIYFFSRAAGIAFSYLGLLGSCAVVAYLMRAKGFRSKLEPVKQLIAPGILVVLASVFIVSLGLLHGGDERPLGLAEGRFGPPQLTADNEIPKLFADAVYAGHIPKPLVNDWLSSDRPPLETGNTLWTYETPRSDLAYLALSVILQCSYLAALWSFLTAYHIDRKPLALSVATCLVSGITLVNGFYTWPKLYPVAFLLIAAAYLLTGRFRLVRGQMTIGAIVGAAVALAILGHGGSVFAIPGMAALMLVLRHFPSRRFLAGMAVAAVVLYAPWALYQRLYDPPGDRLLKWHIAGVVEPRPEASFVGLLFSSYGKLKPGDLVALKVNNLRNLAGDLSQYLEDASVLSKNLVAGSTGARNETAALIRRTMFYHWIPGIGLAILGPLALLLSGQFPSRTSREEFKAALRMWLWTGLTLVFWCLILFGPIATYTTPHQGTYSTEILAFAGSCLAFWALRPWLAVAVTAAQILWNAILFIWLTPAAPSPGVGVTSGPANCFLGAACLLSAAGIVAVLATFALRRAATDRPNTRAAIIA